MVQIGGLVNEPPPPGYDFCPQGRGGVNQLVLIEDEMGGDTGGRGGLTWQAH